MYQRRNRGSGPNTFSFRAQDNQPQRAENQRSTSSHACITYLAPCSAQGASRPLSTTRPFSVVFPEELHSATILQPTKGISVFGELSFEAF